MIGHFSDRPDYKELQSPLGIKLSEPSKFEFGITVLRGRATAHKTLFINNLGELIFYLFSFPSQPP
jgi:hypothetical protein